MDNLVLTGFMGTGKSTVGPLVADALRMPLVDTDTLIVQRAGISIPEIFARDGEAAFRQLERAVILELISECGRIIATGGGALINPQTRADVLRNNLVICLTAEPDVLRARLSGDSGRPLASQWEQVLAQRLPIYRSFSFCVDTSHHTPQQVAEEVAAIWRKQSP